MSLKKRWSLLCHPRLAKGLLVTMIGGYALLFAALTLLRHRAFQTTYFDLEIFNQSAWNTHQGRILFTSNVTQNAESLLAQHFQPILIPLSLLYSIHSGPESMPTSGAGRVVEHI